MRVVEKLKCEQHPELLKKNLEEIRLAIVEKENDFWLENLERHQSGKRTIRAKKRCSLHG